MQRPTSSTPVARCLELAIYASRMLGKFSDNPMLAESARRLAEGQGVLKLAQDAYETAAGAALAIRVDVGYEDYAADRLVRRTQQLAELDDGRRGGRIASQVFPGGSTPITRLQGESQVVAMRDLEARLDAARDIWPQAEAEKAAIEAQRIRYQEALAARQDSERNINDLRLARDAAKERFLDIYTQVANLVQAEFPRDRVIQNLFFDVVRPRAASRSGGSSQGAEPATGTPEPASSNAAA